MAIDLSRPHYTNRAAARRRIEAVARDLAEELNLDYRWDGDRLRFQRLGAKGSIRVDDTHVHIHLTRSPFLPVSEAWLTAQLQQYLDEHLPEAPPPKADPKTQTTSTPQPTTPPRRSSSADASFLGRLTSLAGAMTEATLHTTTSSAQVPLKVAEALLGSEPSVADTTAALTPEEQAAGHALREMRQQRGLSKATLAAQVDLPDARALDAIEAGTARPSVHVLLSLAAHLAFEDPMPFLVHMTQAYYPAIWTQLQAWGITAAPVLSPREEAFLNVYRTHPDAFRLSEDAFEEVLRLAKANFDAAALLSRGEG